LETVTNYEITWCQRVLKSWGNLITFDQLLVERDFRKLLKEKVDDFYVDKAAKRLPNGNRSILWKDGFRINTLNKMGQKLYRFVWEARSNMLPTCKRLQLWKKISDKCHCGEIDNVSHVVGSCNLNLGLYRKRHNLVNQVLYDHILKNDYQLVKKEYAPIRNDRRFDIFLEKGDKDYIIETSIVWNNNLDEKFELKSNQYREYLNYLRTTLNRENEQTVFILGQLGGYHLKSTCQFQANIRHRGWKLIKRRVQGIAIYGSFWCWMARCRRFAAIQNRNPIPN